MTIDWAATGQMISGLGAWAGAIAVAYAAWLGSRTFTEWRAQELTSRRIDQAQTILTATYRVRRALRTIRTPGWMSTELFVAEREFDEIQGSHAHPKVSIDERNRILDGYIYRNRVAKFSDVQRELDHVIPTARALFGQPIEEQIEVLARLFTTIEVVASGSSENDPDFASWRSQVLNDRGDSELFPNETTQRVDAAISAIEGACLPILS